MQERQPELRVDVPAFGLHCEQAQGGREVAALRGGLGLGEVRPSRAHAPENHG
ncbi:MAG: hypothetical protein ACREVJ_03575 [Gammaproteobacteria bacterium]